MSEKDGENEKDNQGVDKDFDVDSEEKVQKPGPSSARNPEQRKNIRFQIPTDVISDESYASALSNDSREIEDDYDDFKEPAPISLFKKFTFSPLNHSQPRRAAEYCFPSFSDSDTYILPNSSSQQLSEILKHSPSPSDVDVHLVKATYLRKLEDVKEAISKGANVNAFTDRETPLLIATELGDHRLAEYLISVPHVNPDFQNNSGQTPLAVAVRNGFIKIARLLLSNNADVNIPDHMGRTPLYEALFQQRPSLVKLLLAYGADIEVVDCFGEKPIYTPAVRRRHLECLIILLKMGATVNYINISGIPLLSRTIMNGTDFSIIEALIQHGASVNAQDLISKKTPLHFTVIQNDIRVAKLLISHGADVNLKTVYNFTPYDEAIFHKSLHLATYLKGVMNRKKIIQSVPPIVSLNTNRKKKRGLQKPLNKKLL